MSTTNLFLYEKLLGFLLRALYDEKGILLESRLDLCDCLRKDCPGCFFSCKNCSGTKCGNTCRCDRNTYYEKIEIEGSSTVRENPIRSKND